MHARMFLWLVCNAFISPSQCERHRRLYPLDWRRAGVLTTVKNQSLCGSCWVHATLAVVEAQLVLCGWVDQPTNLAVKPLLEWNRQWHGCLGGTVTESITHLYTYGALRQEDVYRHSYYYYPEHQQILPPSRVHEVTLSRSYSAVIKSLSDTPLVVLVSAISDNFQTYQEGIFDGECSSTVDHAMVLVGLNTELQYWILRNSWGIHWGEQGYMRMTFGAAERCGMFQQVTRPTLLCQPRVVCSMPRYPTQLHHMFSQ